MRARWRRLRFGLSTVLGLAPRGFFIPYRYAGSVEPNGYPALEALFRVAEPRFEETVAAIEAVADDLRRIEAAGGSGGPRFAQDWFPRLDAAAAYAIVRREAPRRIVEIGSGHSTRFLARAVADGGLGAEMICIDPAPRAAIGGLDRVRHEPRLLRDTDPALLAALEPGDVLFIDSSHVAAPGTDVDRLFLDALPRLADGVLVHVHDILLPDAYPDAWGWRGYNEQLVVGALLQGDAYELIFASHYVRTRRPDLVDRGVVARLSLQPGARETSLWLRKGTPSPERERAGRRS